MSRPILFIPDPMIRKPWLPNLKLPSQFPLRAKRKTTFDKLHGLQLTLPLAPPPAPLPRDRSSRAPSLPSRTTTSHPSAPDTTCSTRSLPQSSRPSAAGSIALETPAYAKQIHETVEHP